MNFTSNVDFSRSNTLDTVRCVYLYVLHWKNSLASISLFESTIRYIGGLLSAYELSGKQHRSLVTKAAQLADKLIYAWVGVRSCSYFSSHMLMAMLRKMIFHLGNLISTTCLSIKMLAGSFLYYCSSQPDVTCALVQYR